MSVAIIGGLDRLKRSYEEKGNRLGYRVKVFSHKVPNLGERLSGMDRIVIFTGTVAHQMVNEVVRIARKYNIPVGRVHNSSVSAMARCLEPVAVF